MIKRIGLIFLVIPLLAIGCQHKQKPLKPNIVYILADDLGYGDVSAFNENAAWQTPNIDRLASEGMIFTDAHSGSAVCTPTRYGVLTGRYAWRSSLKSGVTWSWDDALIQEGRITVGSLLQTHGYKTACIGKWHLGLGWQQHEEIADSIDFSKQVLRGPVTRGFDYFFGIPASLDIPPYVYIENDRVTALPDRMTISETKYGWWRLGHTGSDFIHEQVLPKLTEKAVAFIDNHVKNNNNLPFFLYFPLPAPHTPILPLPEFQGKTGTNPYGDFVFQVDWTVRQILEALEKHGLTENTLIIFTSDNGCSPQARYDELAEYGHNPSYIFRGHKADIFEGGHRIPFMARWPGVIKPGTRSEETICLTDLLATTADIMDDPLPDNAGEDSYSLLPLFEGESFSTPLREATVHHSVNGSFAIRKGKWKLILCPGSGGWSYPVPVEAKKMDLPPFQLYDMSIDIGEQNNLAADYPRMVNELKELLKQYILSGRSTPGEPQEYVKSEKWPGLTWMELYHCYDLGNRLFIFTAG